MASCFRERDGFDNLRKSIHATVTKQSGANLKRKFVAGLLKAKLDAGGVGKTVYDDVARQIAEFIKGNIFPPNFDKKWFKRLVDLSDESSPKLRHTYRWRHLGRQEIEKLAALPRENLPSI
jgi:hypothetical protein